MIVRDYIYKKKTCLSTFKAENWMSIILSDKYEKKLCRYFEVYQTVAVMILVFLKESNHMHLMFLNKLKVIVWIEFWHKHDLGSQAVGKVGYNAKSIQMEKG